MILTGDRKSMSGSGQGAGAMRLILEMFRDSLEQLNVGKEKVGEIREDARVSHREK